MHQFLTHLAHFFASLGGLGLLLLGTLDSSILFLPLGNALLLVLLTVKTPAHMIYYAMMAAVGSLIGCFITESLSRKGGEAGLEGRVSPRRLRYIQAQVTERAGLMLALAALMPPPFPFTMFVIVAGALKYPRIRLLSVIGIARLARFLIEGFLALHYGRRILELSSTPVVQGIVLAIVIISVGGSAWSIYSWVKRSRKART
jgi:membrane protein YqaA with SNARE-associated domain